jgi:hypothetical protein
MLISNTFGGVREIESRSPVAIIINIPKSASFTMKEITTMERAINMTAQYQSAVFSFLLYSRAFQEILFSMWKLYHFKSQCTNMLKVFGIYV